MTSTSSTSNVPDKKDGKSLRLITFNVNGVKTLFNYFPWNKLQLNYDSFFNQLHGDIITLQELKLSSSTLTSSGGNIGNLKEFQSFITIPKSKRGYSGVGVFVRRSSILVLKAEEGITGWLPSPDNPTGLPYREIDTEKLIGGYPTESNLSKERALELDSEGRCICIEIPNNIVIISVYCPANSMGTEEGESFRMDFLNTLLKRCFDLKHSHNKEVILMGDINVSLDLIDSAEGIQDRIKLKTILPATTNESDNFESRNIISCIEFKTSKPSRKLLNRYTVPSFVGFQTDLIDSQIFYDTTRQVQGRRMGMYTVWNTMTSARQSNFGSRIDLILATDGLCKSATDADICPSVNGSDHCPVYTDFDFKFVAQGGNMLTKLTLKFEAKNYYKLVQHRDISLMFGKPIVTERKSNQSTPPSPSASPSPSTSELVSNAVAPSTKRKLEYVSRKTSKKTTSTSINQLSISNFFFKEKMDTTSCTNSNTDTYTDSNASSIEEKLPILNASSSTTKTSTPKSIVSISNLLYGNQPKCLHNEPCQLKTSLSNPKTRGKKFWCCARNLVGLNTISSKTIGEHRCNFFEWTKSAT